jgi:hypothetical protein
MKRYLFFVLAMALQAGCGQRGHSGKESTEFIAGLRSHSSQEIVKTTLGAASAGWIATTERATGSEGGKAVTYDVTLVRIAVFTDLGVRGSLTLQFINDQLCTAWFFPSDWETYLKALEKKRGLRLSPGEETLIGSHTRLSLDPQRHFVAWEDDEIEGQFRRAIS